MTVDHARWEDAARGSVALREAVQAALGLPATIFLPAPRRTSAPKLVKPSRPPEPVCVAATAIKVEVADFYGISLDQLVGNSHRREYAWPRQMAFLLVRGMLGKSYPAIGRLFGNRDHTTVIHGLRAVTKRIEAGGDDAEDYAALMDILAPEAMAA
jgi:hypothetical protein